MPEPRHRQRIVIVGAGFAGFHAARTLSRLARQAGRQQAAGIEIVLINPTDYFLYLPLLPEVAGGVLDSAPGGRAAARSLPRCPAAGRHSGADRSPRPSGKRGRARRRSQHRALRPAAAHHGQRQQAATRSRHRPAQPRVPQHRRGALPLS